MLRPKRPWRLLCSFQPHFEAGNLSFVLNLSTLDLKKAFHDVSSIWPPIHLYFKVKRVRGLLMSDWHNISSKMKRIFEFLMRISVLSLNLQSIHKNHFFVKINIFTIRAIYFMQENYCQSKIISLHENDNF